MSRTGTSSGTGVIGADATDAFGIWGNNGQDKLVSVLQGGNVGIGTSSPDSPLEVQGNVNGVHQVHIQNNFDDDDENVPNPSTRLLLSAVSNNAYLEAHGAPEDSAGLHKVDLGSTAATSFITFSPNSTERMRIDTSGNVGIGTDSPYEKFQVDGNIRLGTTDLGVDDDADYNITSGGQLNIHANDSGENQNYVALNLKCGNSGGSEAASSRISCFVNDSEKMRITSLGRVGIGTTNPASDSKLNVNGGDIVVSNSSSFNHPAILFYDNDDTQVMSESPINAGIVYNDSATDDENIYLGLSVWEEFDASTMTNLWVCNIKKT